MPARRPTKIQGVRERRFAALAAISAMPSQRRVVGISDGNVPLLDSSDRPIASVATAMAAGRILFFIGAERYAGWERVSMATRLYALAPGLPRKFWRRRIGCCQSPARMGLKREKDSRAKPSSRRAGSPA